MTRIFLFSSCFIYAIFFGFTGYFLSKCLPFFDTGTNANEAKDGLAEKLPYTTISVTKTDPCDPATTLLTQLITDVVVVNRTAQKNTTDSDNGKLWGTTDSHNGKLWSTTDSDIGT
jgi:hypothetical protein